MAVIIHIYMHLPELGLHRPRLVQMAALAQSALVAATHWSLARVQRPSVRHWLLAWQSAALVGVQAPELAFKWQAPSQRHKSLARQSLSLVATQSSWTRLHAPACRHTSAARQSLSQPGLQMGPSGRQ